MRQSTRDKVWQVLYDFALSQLPKRERWTLEDIKLAYPYHKLMFSEEAILSARIERSIVTTMGDQLYPALAKTIAEDNTNSV